MVIDQDETRVSDRTRHRDECLSTHYTYEGSCELCPSPPETPPDDLRELLFKLIQILITKVFIVQTHVCLGMNKGVYVMTVLKRMMI